ncbi:MAG: DNA translocase FtsK 4TM domain-containing protein [Flavobacteriales bacterium]
MAKNILLKDTEASSGDKGASSKRKKRAPKAQPDSKWNFTLFSQARETWQDERTRSVAGLVSLGLALVFALAVVSSFFTGSLDIRILQNEGVTDELEAYHNVLGSLGAHIGFFLARQGLGVGALSIPFLLGLLGLRWLTDRPFLPLAKTLRLSAFLAMFVPWALAFLTHTAPEANQTAVSALNDHVTGAAGLWLLGQSLHWGGALGSSLFLMLTIGIMLAFNTPALWNRLGQRLGAWFKSSEETMMEEDALDEAAVKEAASGDDFVASNAVAAAATGNVLLPKDEPSEVEEDVPFEVSPAAEAVPDPQPEPNATAPEVEAPVADEPAQAEATPAPPTPGEQDEEGDVEGDVEFEVKEVQEEETLSSEELEDLAEEFGEEYDPTLDLGRFQLPHLDKLENHGDGKNRVTDEELQQNKENILRTLANFNIEVSKITAEVGPTVTLYEIVPAPGIRISKIKNLEDDIALSLAALGIRIIAPIPGKGTIGIEVPNSNPDVVSMRTLIASDKFQNSDAALPIALGKTISNETYVFDMAKMPHLLMAGATGQGKSVGLNAMLVSMLYRKHPSQLKFVLVDPKKVELTLYNKIVRHYLAQLPDSEDAIITDTSKVVSTLNSLCVEMDHRYELLKAAQCRNLKEYNAKFIKRKIIPGAAVGHPDNGSDLHRNGHHYMPYIVLVVDEFADLIMTAGKEVETPIARLAQLARAIGIHLIIATQRPSVNIITGTIKANFPARVAFRVTSKIDSRTILDAGGADQLIGRGDMLMSTGNDLIRLQCGFVDTPEVEDICEFIGSQQGYPTPYELPPPPAEASESSGSLDDDERDPMFEDAARVLVMHQQGSTSLLQRKLKLGYNRAGRLIDQLETAGIIGPFEGSKARKVLVPDEASLEQLLQSSSTTTE